VSQGLLGPRFRGDDSDIMATPPTTIAPDVQAEIARWLSYLGTERRMSGKTVEAYARDVAQFLGFLAAHSAAPP
jgi:hypothetical protein